MSKQTLQLAKSAALEFLRRVKAVEHDSYSMEYMGVRGTKLTAAVHRQSMELTRALTALRQSQRELFP